MFFTDPSQFTIMQWRQSFSSGFDGQAASRRSSGSSTPLYRWQVLCGKKQVAPPDKKDGLTLTLVSPGGSSDKEVGFAGILPSRTDPGKSVQSGSPTDLKGWVTESLLVPVAPLDKKDGFEFIRGSSEVSTNIVLANILAKVTWVKYSSNDDDDGEDQV